MYIYSLTSGTECLQHKVYIQLKYKINTHNYNTDVLKQQIFKFEVLQSVNTIFKAQYV